MICTYLYYLDPLSHFYFELCPGLQDFLNLSVTPGKIFVAFYELLHVLFDGHFRICTFCIVTPFVIDPKNFFTLTESKM